MSSTQARSPGLAPIGTRRPVDGSPVGTPRGSSPHTTPNPGADRIASVAASSDPIAAALATTATRSDAARVCLLANWSNTLTKDAIGTWMQFVAHIKESGLASSVDEKVSKMLVDSAARLVLHNNVNVGKAVDQIESAFTTEALPAATNRAASVGNPRAPAALRARSSAGGAPSDSLVAPKPDAPSPSGRAPAARKRTSSQASVGSDAEDNSADVPTPAAAPKRSRPSASASKTASVAGGAPSRPAPRPKPKKAASDVQQQTSSVSQDGGEQNVQ